MKRYSITTLERSAYEWEHGKITYIHYVSADSPAEALETVRKLAGDRLLEIKEMWEKIPLK